MKTNYILLSASKKTDKQGPYQKKAYLKKKVEKKLESRQENDGPKGEHRRSNRTRQNKKAGRKVASNDEPEIRQTGGNIRNVWPPFRTSPGSLNKQ